MFKIRDRVRHWWIVLWWGILHSEDAQRRYLQRTAMSWSGKPLGIADMEKFIAEQRPRWRQVVRGGKVSEVAVPGSGDDVTALMSRGIVVMSRSQYDGGFAPLLCRMNGDPGSHITVVERNGAVTEIR